MHQSLKDDLLKMARALERNSSSINKIMTIINTLEELRLGFNTSIDFGEHEKKSHEWVLVVREKGRELAVCIRKLIGGHLDQRRQRLRTKAIWVLNNQGRDALVGLFRPDYPDVHYHQITTWLRFEETSLKRIDAKAERIFSKVIL